MNRWGLRLLTVAMAALAVGQVSAARAEILIVHGRTVPSGAVSAPATQVRSDSVRLARVDSPANGYRYSMDEATRLLGTVQVSYAQPPQGYWTSDLEVRVPYRRSVPLQVSVYAIKPVEVGDENRRIRELFATAIGEGGEQRHDELFRLYQEASSISLNRLGRIKRQDDFNYMDAKVFLKLMEIAVYLGRGASLALSPQVKEVRNFVRGQLSLSLGRRVMLDGTGQSLTRVESQLVFVDFVEADHLKSLWAAVKQQTNGAFSDDACNLYIAFSNTITTGDYDQGLLEAWDRHPQYQLVTLAAKAVEVCASREQVRQSTGTGSEVRLKAIVGATKGLERVTSPRVANSVTNIKKALRLTATGPGS